jgi:tRNA A37 threonylcarbamoyladenosine dehydratase
VGLGGVGSWAAEALARSGIGTLALMDLDEVCVSNINRQVHALHNTVGKLKCQLLKERMLQINPQMSVIAIEEFLTLDNLDLITPYNYVIDAIDGVSHKAALLNHCLNKNIPVITAGAAAGKKHPGAIECRDLSRTVQDPLLQRVRKKLRADFGHEPATKTFAKPFHIKAVYSHEPVKELTPSTSEESGSFCDVGLGSCVTVTASMGLRCAYELLALIKS